MEVSCSPLTNVVATSLASQVAAEHLKSWLVQKGTKFLILLHLILVNVNLNSHMWLAAPELDSVKST